ncbi:MAG: phosphate ABC transporter permease PstA [Acholeplasmatales bacterium]|nr:phosphate ABC transporter permease PstA [Acholeplasmatales bacterium]
MKINSRKMADGFRYSLTWISTIFCAFVLLAIIFYVFSQGVNRLSWDLITSDYEEKLISAQISYKDIDYENPNIENAYFSNKYGIAIKDSETIDGIHSIEIVYVDSKSPFLSAKNRISGERFKIGEGSRIDILIGFDENGDILDCSGNDSAEYYAKVLDNAITIKSIQCKTSGGGIRGSLITTLLLIIITLIIAVPLGVGAAIYLVEYAKEGRFKRIIQTMIDMTSGIPSIIFGFCGALIFIPFVSAISSAEGYSVMAGALTMTIILLPTIIKTTSEALMVIPNHYTMASLALGASKTQTVFKVIIPNALPGILTSILLSIGRIIGESAALIFVIGTAISDSVSPFGASTSLSVHIWSITGGENPNYETACAISIIILIVVFVLSILVKLISKRLNRMAVIN